MTNTEKKKDHNRLRAGVFVDATVMRSSKVLIGKCWRMRTILWLCEYLQGIRTRTDSFMIGERYVHTRRFTNSKAKLARLSGDTETSAVAFPPCNVFPAPVSFRFQKTIQQIKVYHKAGWNVNNALASRRDAAVGVGRAHNALALLFPDSYYSSSLSQTLYHQFLPQPYVRDFVMQRFIHISSIQLDELSGKELLERFILGHLTRSPYED